MEDSGVEDALINKILTDHCLAHIFSFLPIPERLDIEKVCKRWRIISEEGWQDIKEFQIIHDHYSEDKIHVIMKRCGRFLKKIFICIKQTDCKCLSIAMNYCELDQLEAIGIGFGMISGDDALEKHQLNMCKLSELFGKTKKLVAVSIKGDLRYYNTDQLNSLNLEILRINHMGMSCFPVALNLDRFPNLKEARLVAVKFIVDDELEIKEDSLKGLEKFDLLHCYILQDFIPRIKTFTNLQELCLGLNVCNIDDEHIREIANNCQKIKKLVLFSYCDMTTECFKYLGKMPSLEVLIFQYFKNISDFNILKLTNVHQLFIQKCDIINVDALLGLIVNSTRLEKLEFLNVEGTLCRYFLEGVGRIFHDGQREKHLTLVVSVFDEVQSFRTLREKIGHPLLDLELFTQLPRESG